jgi:hypothetical protein
VLEGMVGELVEFDMDRQSAGPIEGSASQSGPPLLPPLPRLAAALSTEGHMLASLLPHERPPDMLGMGRVIKVMGLVAERATAA